MQVVQKGPPGTQAHGNPRAKTVAGLNVRALEHVANQTWARLQEVEGAWRGGVRLEVKNCSVRLGGRSAERSIPPDLVVGSIGFS